MPSLLKEVPEGAQWPLTLALPSIDFGVTLPSGELMENATTNPKTNYTHASDFKRLSGFRQTSDKPLEGIAAPFKSSIFNAGYLTSTSEIKFESKDSATNLLNTSAKKQRKARKRTKAWLCKHYGSAHYAKGICQFCYLKRYHAERNEKLKTVVYI